MMILLSYHEGLADIELTEIVEVNKNFSRSFTFVPLEFLRVLCDQMNRFPHMAEDDDRPSLFALTTMSSEVPKYNGLTIVRVGTAESIRFYCPLQPKGTKY